MNHDQRAELALFREAARVTAEQGGRAVACLEQLAKQGPGTGPGERDLADRALESVRAIMRHHRDVAALTEQNAPRERDGLAPWVLRYADALELHRRSEHDELEDIGKIEELEAALAAARIEIGMLRAQVDAPVKANEPADAVGETVLTQLRALVNVGVRTFGGRTMFEWGVTRVGEHVRIGVVLGVD